MSEIRLSASHEAKKLTTDYLDNAALQIKEQQKELKEDVSNTFLNELRKFVDYSFMPPKDKKENFITREKMILELLKLYKSQKYQFREPRNTFDVLRFTAVYDKDTHDIGRIVWIDSYNKKVVFFTYYDMLNKRPAQEKDWKDVLLFDYNSIQFEALYKTYKFNNPNGLDKLKMQEFLMAEQHDNIVFHTPQPGFGMEYRDATQTPVMQMIIEDHAIPQDVLKPKPKRRLLQLDSKTLEIVASFASVKEAGLAIGMKQNSIQNVICQGGSASKYLDAYGYKWSWSNEPNPKYNSSFDMDKFIDEIDIYISSL